LHFWFAKSLTSDILLSLLLSLLPAFVRIFFATEAEILCGECNFAYRDKIEYPSLLGRRCNGRQASKLLYAWRDGAEVVVVVEEEEEEEEEEKAF
jgi:hypothetical protein